MCPKLTKAKIIILEGVLKGKPPLEVLFNPAEYTHEISNNYQEVALPGLCNPILQFVNGETQSLTMELFFDTWTNQGGKNVTELTEKFAKLLEIDEKLHAPPPVKFSWGGFCFKAVVQSLSQRFTMFNAEGQPVRATLNVTFKLYRPLNEQVKSPRCNSADRTKRRVLTADDSLWAMAAREYDHPREWRRIAAKNRVENPRLLRAGEVLVLPPMDNKDEFRGT